MNIRRRERMEPGGRRRSGSRLVYAVHAARLLGRGHRTAGARTAPGAANRTANSGTRPLILLYHSIARRRLDPWGIAVRPAHFAEQMAVLRDIANPMSLAQLHKALDAGQLPRRAAVITFDDGYVDNLLAAKPILQWHDVPATVFVASGYVGSTHEYWWEELDRLLLPGRVPGALDVGEGVHPARWQLNGSAWFSPIAAWRARHWRTWHDAPSQRHIVFREMWEALRRSDPPHRDRALERLRPVLGRGRRGRANRRCVNLEQLRDLADGGLIEIGAHTVTHPALSGISVEAQRHEIDRCKRDLEDMLQMPVASFSYPFGTRGDYTIDTVRLVREAGFRRACSNFPEPLGAGVDRFQLPRRVVADWDGREFAQRLERWFADEPVAAQAQTPVAAVA